MQLDRHPLHPAIVHFPIACWLLVSVCDALYIWEGGQEWRVSAELLLITGLVSALAATVFGLFDIKRAQRYGQKLPAAFDQHITFVGSAWCVYVLSLGCRQQSDHKISLQSSAETTHQFIDSWFIAASVSALVAAVLLLIGAWFGAELVYKYGIGRKLPGSGNN